MSLAMAMTALAIDSMLPAFDPIREQFGLDPGATDVAVLVTAFLVGFGLGQIPAGLFADRFGRRPVLWGGVAIYIVGAVGTVLAPTLATMALARFVWGLGAAGPRVRRHRHDPRRVRGRGDGSPDVEHHGDLPVGPDGRAERGCGDGGAGVMALRRVDVHRGRAGGARGLDASAGDHAPGSAAFSQRPRDHQELEDRA